MLFDEKNKNENMIENVGNEKLIQIRMVNTVKHKV